VLVELTGRLGFGLFNLTDQAGRLFDAIFLAALMCSGSGLIAQLQQALSDKGLRQWLLTAEGDAFPLIDTTLWN